MQNRATPDKGKTKKKADDQRKIEGEKETKIAIVKKLHENNMTIEQIAQIVELEEDEINKILNEN